MEGMKERDKSQEILKATAKITRTIILKKTLRYATASTTTQKLVSV